MKVWRRLVAGGAGVLVLLGLGCKTTAPIAPEVLRTRVEAVTTIAVSKVLKERPEWEPCFVEVQARLAELLVKAGDDKLTLIEVLDVLKELPIKELQSEDAKLVVETAKLLFFDPLNRVEIQTPVRVRAVVEGLIAGIEKGV